MITGADLIAIEKPIERLNVFYNLQQALCLNLLKMEESPRFSLLILEIRQPIPKTLPLADRTKVRAAPRKLDLADRRPADLARLAGAQVHPVFQLKEPAHPVGIHIV